MPSSLKLITGFSFAGLSPAVTGVINEVTHTVALTVPFGTVVTALVPTIVVSAAAHVDPHTAVAADFTSPVTYTVTAEDLSTQAYVVTVITSLVLLKQYLQLGADDTSRDTLIQSMWDGAVATIEGELGYSLTSHSVTQQSVGSSQIAFTDLPVTSLTVKYRGTLTDTVGTTDEALTAWTDYYVFTRHIELRTSRCSDPRIILSYTAGYSTLPAPLENAVRLLVAYDLNLATTAQPGTFIDKRIPSDVANLLKPYMPLTLP